MSEHSALEAEAAAALRAKRKHLVGAHGASRGVLVRLVHVFEFSDGPIERERVSRVGGSPRCQRRTRQGCAAEGTYLTIVKVSRCGLDRPAELVAMMMRV